jgi:hypothetical protein
MAGFCFGSQIVAWQSEQIGLAGLKPVPVRRPGPGRRSGVPSLSIFPKAVINRALATQALVLFRAVILWLPERLFNVTVTGFSSLTKPCCCRLGSPIPNTMTLIEPLRD